MTSIQEIAREIRRTLEGEMEIESLKELFDREKIRDIERRDKIAIYWILSLIEMDAIRLTNFLSNYFTEEDFSEAWGLNQSPKG